MTASVTELKTLLNQDMASLDSLKTILNEERQALGSNDMAGIDALAKRKNEILEAIRARAREKVRLLVGFGFQPSSGNPSEFLQSLGDTELDTLWQDAREAMDRCQSANTVNGQVINHLQKRVGRISEIIRGANLNQKLYGAAGKEQALSHKTILANA